MSVFACRTFGRKFWHQSKRIRCFERETNENRNRFVSFTVQGDTRLHVCGSTWSALTFPGTLPLQLPIETYCKFLLGYCRHGNPDCTQFPSFNYSRLSCIHPLIKTISRANSMLLAKLIRLFFTYSQPQDCVNFLYTTALEVSLPPGASFIKYSRLFS